MVQDEHVVVYHLSHYYNALTGEHLGEKVMFKKCLVVVPKKIRLFQTLVLAVLICISTTVSQTGVLAKERTPSDRGTARSPVFVNPGKIS